MSLNLAVVGVSAAAFMIGVMLLVKATEREWRDFGIFWIVVLAVVGAAHMLRATWEILER